MRASFLAPNVTWEIRLNKLLGVHISNKEQEILMMIIHCFAKILEKKKKKISLRVMPLILISYYKSTCSLSITSITVYEKIFYSFFLSWSSIYVIFFQYSVVSCFIPLKTYTLTFPIPGSTSFHSFSLVSGSRMYNPFSAALYLHTECQWWSSVISGSSGKHTKYGF